MWETTVFPVFFVIFIIVYLYYDRKYKNFEKSFQKQALKRDGKIASKREGLWKIPRLYLHYEDNEISISPLKRKGHSQSNSVSYIYAECFIRQARNYMVAIHPEYTLKKIGKIFGMQDIQINNPDFDKLFLVKGDDELMVRELLTPDIQGLLVAIGGLEPSIRIENREFECSLSKVMTKDEELDLFLDTVMAIIKRAHELA